MFAHPLWLVGFRPFFTLAFVSGAVLPLLWVLVYLGAVTLPAGLDPIRWHAHEMFYGFGWAVMAGFLLTASKNWVNVRGMHGGPLAFAVLLWLVERVAILLPISPISYVLLNAFTLYVVGYVVWTLVRHHAQDTFKDNWYFIFALPLFLFAKNALLMPSSWTIGTTLTLGLFRLAFVVMFERTMTQFMRNAMGTPLPRYKPLDYAIKTSVFIAAFEGFFSAPLAATATALAGLLLFARFTIWKPLVGLRRFDIAIMYVGYFGLVVHFALAALRYAGVYNGIGTLAVHAFTLLVMGIVIPGMLIRICQGHTGRKLLFTRSDRFAIGAMGVAAFARLVLTQVAPSLYARWIEIAGLGWALCFVILGVRLVPFLFQPRIDGREH